MKSPEPPVADFLMSKYKPKAKDGLGARKGTTVAKINRVLSRKWQTVDEIARKTRTPRKIVAQRLYYGVSRGIYEHQKIIRFKLK